MNEPLRGFPAMVSHEDTKYTKGKVIPYIFLVVFASLCLCGPNLCAVVGMSRYAAYPLRFPTTTQRSEGAKRTKG